MYRIAPLFVVLALALVAGCEDSSTGQIDPMISSDTVALAAPGSVADLPSALDVSANVGIIGGGRRPESQQDAERWDIAIRVQDGVLMFVPATALGLASNAAITHPLTGQTFEQVREAPGSGSFVADSAIAVEVGSVYVVRSRTVSCGFGAASQYAKIQPLEASAADGTVTVRIATNEVCGDPRLVGTD